MRKRRKEPLFELGRYWLNRVPGSQNIYRFWYDDGDRKVRCRSTGTSDLEEAKTQLAAIVITRPVADQGVPEHVLLTAVLTHYWTTHSDATPGAEQARRAGTLLVEWLVDVQGRPDAKVSDFSRVWQDEFIKWCATKKNHAVATVSRNMSIIGAALNHAVKRTVVEEDGKKRELQLLKYAVPVVYQTDEISRLTGKPKPVARNWLPTWEQIAMFVDGIGRRSKDGGWDERYENLFRYVVMALNTWARPEAILELCVSAQVDFGAGLVRLNPPGRKQTKKVRPDLPLTDNLRQWLEHWNLDRPIHNRGEPLTTVKKVFRAHARRMGLPQFTPYTIRHFMATNVRRIPGCPVSREQRQEWLGHKRQDTTSWYEHHDPEWLREARIATDELLKRLGGMLKTRTLFPVSSKIAPKPAADEPAALKLFVPTNGN